ncbi:MAG: F0F1 ATP synthase subunit A [Hyphomonas sp.]
MTFLMPSAAIDPIHQFQVSKWLDLQIGGVDLSFTNASGFMLLGVVPPSPSALRLPRVCSCRPACSRWPRSAMASSQTWCASAGEGLKFFPFVFTLFFFIFANMIGMVPYAFTTTSHIIVTAALALLVIGIVIGYGFYKNGLKFFKLFAPSGAPFLIYFLLVPIEVISFFARPLTLALRLFANMLAGHIMLKLFAGFAVALIGAGIAYIPVAILAFSMGVALNALEFLVAGLQAYVFAILTCVYLNDAIHPGH